MCMINFKYCIKCAGWITDTYIHIQIWGFKWNLAISTNGNFWVLLASRSGLCLLSSQPRHYIYRTQEWQFSAVRWMVINDYEKLMRPDFIRYYMSYYSTFKIFLCSTFKIFRKLTSQNEKLTNRLGLEGIKQTIKYTKQDSYKCLY